MLKIGNSRTFGWYTSMSKARSSISGASDTNWIDYYCSGERIDGLLGDKDLSLLTRYAKGCSVERQFLDYINVSVDIDAPLYWWQEFHIDSKDIRYIQNVSIFNYDANNLRAFIEYEIPISASKIYSKVFELVDFSHEDLRGYQLNTLRDTIQALNVIRTEFLRSHDKRDWSAMVQLLPASYNQSRTVQFTYSTLCDVYKLAKTSSLDEWAQLADWIESLPYSHLITTGGECDERSKM